jgi:hypothetical protein
LLRLLLLPWFLQLLLLVSLFLLLLCQMMTDSAPGGGTEDGVMPRHVSCYCTNGGTLDAAFRLCAVRCKQ